MIRPNHSQNPYIARGNVAQKLMRPRVEGELSTGRKKQTRGRIRSSWKSRRYCRRKQKKQRKTEPEAHRQ